MENSFRLVENPKIGDVIYVPDFVSKNSKSGWDRMEKKGGYGNISFLQQTENDLLVFVREFGGFGIWWSQIKDKQKDFSQLYGIEIRAQLI